MEPRGAHGTRGAAQGGAGQGGAGQSGGARGGAGARNGAAVGPALLLLHGTATTGAVWSGVRVALAGREVHAPDRPSTGDLAAEIAALAPSVAGRVLGGVSGGATLGLAMLAAGVPMAAAVLHEPAVGSLVPGLLGPVAEAFTTGGVVAFGQRLYGPRWNVGHAPSDLTMVERDLAMFLAFEPGPPPAGAPPVLVTVGAQSPPVRHRAAAALRARFGLPVRVLPGCGHAVHLEAPELFAALLAETADGLPR
ncbi:alpha/beta fold hydrolase [Parafrankia discariae]|uniref:alpha/beta fold hydrolase n=1 Tax=Parafrankia discariae TaxID=365528 RepID=UPI0004754BF2|nr:alpha/beta fold hydrolase [Parafrankia discariae]